MIATSVSSVSVLGASTPLEQDLSEWRSGLGILYDKSALQEAGNREEQALNNWIWSLGAPLSAHSGSQHRPWPGRVPCNTERKT